MTRLPPPRLKWSVLATVSVGLFAATVMATGLNVALPTLVRTFDSAFAVVQWVVLSYFLTNVTLLPLIGRLADMLGKRTLFAWGMAIFAAGSLLCALAPGIAWLIALRVVQGAGSALITALGLAIITETFPRDERGKAIGIAGSALSVGIVIGPTLGGFLLDALSWRWVFVVAVPIGTLGAIATLIVVPLIPSRGRQRFDLAGAAVLFTSLLALALGLTLGQGRGFGDALVLGLLGMGAWLAALFVWLERRVPEPLIDLSIFRSSLFSVGLVSALATFVAIAGTIFLMPFYLENILGYPPRQVGILMAVVPVVLVLVSPLAGILSDRYGTRPITILGLALILCGYILVGTLDEKTTALGYILRFLPLGLGMGTFQTPNNSAIMGAVPRERLGVASGLLSTTRTFGATAGIAALGTLWAVRVSAWAEVPFGADATRAPADAQIAGLHDVMTVVQLMILLALLLCLWDAIRRRRAEQLPHQP